MNVLENQALLGSVETFAIFALVGTLVFSARLSA